MDSVPLHNFNTAEDYALHKNKESADIKNHTFTFLIQLICTFLAYFHIEFVAESLIKNI